MKQVKADDKHMECNYNRRHRDRLWIRIEVVTWENCGCFLSISNFQTLPADNNLQSVAFGSVDRQDCCEILYSLLCLSNRCLYFAVNQILSVNLSANVNRIFGFCNPPELGKSYFPFFGAYMSLFRSTATFSHEKRRKLYRHIIFLSALIVVLVTVWELPVLFKWSSICL